MESEQKIREAIREQIKKAVSNQEVGRPFSDRLEKDIPEMKEEKVEQMEDEEEVKKQLKKYLMRKKKEES